MRNLILVFMFLLFSQSVLSQHNCRGLSLIDSGCGMGCDNSADATSFFGIGSGSCGGCSACCQYQGGLFGAGDTCGLIAMQCVDPTPWCCRDAFGFSHCVADESSGCCSCMAYCMTYCADACLAEPPAGLTYTGGYCSNMVCRVDLGHVSYTPICGGWQCCCMPPGTEFPPPTTLTTIRPVMPVSGISNKTEEIGCKVIIMLQMVAGSLALLLLVLSAFKWMASEDDSSARLEVKGRVMMIIIALILVIVVLQLMNTLFGSVIGTLEC